MFPSRENEKIVSLDAKREPKRRSMQFCFIRQRFQGPRSSGAWIYLSILLLALGTTFAINAQAQTDDDSLADLNAQIVELDQQGKYKEAIPLRVLTMIVDCS